MHAVGCSCFLLLVVVDAVAVVVACCFFRNTTAKAQFSSAGYLSFFTEFWT